MINANLLKNTKVLSNLLQKIKVNNKLPVADNIQAMAAAIAERNQEPQPETLTDATVLVLADAMERILGHSGHTLSPEAMRREDVVNSAFFLCLLMVPAHMKLLREGHAVKHEELYVKTFERALKHFEEQTRVEIAVNGMRHFDHVKKNAGPIKHVLILLFKKSERFLATGEEEIIEDFARILDTMFNLTAKAA